MELATNENKHSSTASEPTDTAPPAAKSDDANIDPLLLSILSTKRRHNSTGDVNFRLWLFNYLKGLKGVTAEVYKEGNIRVKVGKGGTTLFSCHTDTVHSAGECDGTGQQLAFDPMFNHIFLADKTKSTCLGGDDGCGIYIMLKMIAAKKQGWYMFHAGEEVGGVGARAFVNSESKWITDNIKAVVAFDRPTKDGVGPEVISHQGGARCASDEYCAALAKALNTTKFNEPYHVTPNGVFTDSKVYSGIVPECINVSCFYDRQHGKDEYVDYAQLELLTAAAININWEELPVKRDPTAPQFDGYLGMGGRRSAPYFRGSFSDEELDLRVPGFGSERANPKPDFKLGSAANSAPKQKLEDPIDSPWSGMTAIEVVNDMETWAADEFENFILSEPDLAIKVLARLYVRNRGLQAELDACENIMS